jgi:hypothetical protein
MPSQQCGSLRGESDFSTFRNSATFERPLVRDLGVVPRVPTFQNLSTLLAEDGDHQQAIEVCEKAIRFGLSDGTKGDFPARIERLRKQAARGRMVK